MSVFVKPLMYWFMFGMVIETGRKFYMVPFPTQKVADSEFLYKSFVINVLQFQFFFAKPSMNLFMTIEPSLNILRSTVPIPVHDLKIKCTDFIFVKSLQCQLLQSLWLIWIVIGMNGCEILKCFRKEQRASGELPCPATGLIAFLLVGSCVRDVRGIWESFPQSCIKVSQVGVYLINHSSKSIHIWTLGTLEGQLSFHACWT